MTGRPCGHAYGFDDASSSPTRRDISSPLSVRCTLIAAWQASAQALSLGMDAAVVDDNGHPLSVPGFASIGGELRRLYEALAARDLAAGSPAARRLFS